MSQTIPSRLLPSRRTLPWLNKSIVRSMKKRNQLFKRASQFKLARNRTVAMLRSAKQSCFRKLNPRDQKAFWKNCQTREQEQATNPNPVAQWQSG